MNKKNLIRASCLIITAGTIFAFSPALHNGFSVWDDRVYVTDNPAIKAVTFNNIRKIFTSEYVGNYQPLTMLTYTAEYYLFGLNATVFHATNILFHLANAILVFWFFMLLSGRRVAVGLIGALLFAVHPLRVESVAWIAGRKDVLYAFFLLGALIAYHYYVKTEKKDYYALAFACFLCAVLSKAMAVIAPILFFLIDYLERRRLSAKLIAEKVPHLILACIFGVVAFFMQREGVAIKAFMMPYRFFVVFYGFAAYVYKTIFPAHLSVIYPYFPPGVRFYAVSAGTLCVSVACAYVIFRTRRRTRKVVFGALFALVGILPVSQFIPVGGAIIADRYMYLPAIGLSYVAAELFAWCYRKAAIRSRVVSGVCACMCVGLIGTYIGLTYNRVGVWQDSVSLFGEVLRQYPASVVAYKCRAIAYKEAGDLDKALADCMKALEVDGKIADTYSVRGTIYESMGTHDKAIADFTKAIEMDPAFSDAYGNRGLSKNKIGDYDGAIDDCTRAIALNPSMAEAYNSRGYAYDQRGDTANASRDYSKALALNPYFVEAFNNQGFLYFKHGEYAKALDMYNKALENGPDYYECYNNRGCVYLAQGDLGRAMADFMKAVALNNRYAEAYANRGLVYYAQANFDRAIVDFTKAIEISPGFGKAYYCRALAYFQQKKYAESGKDVSRAEGLGYAVKSDFLEKLRAASGGQE